MVTQQVQNWVLLSYRMPRQPSTPRIAVWRKLKQLGVAQIGDGLVALPEDARTKEHLEWVAAQVVEADGQAIVWLAAPSSRRHCEALVQQMREARTQEYDELLDEITAHGPTADRRTIARWRRQWRRIDRRDYLRAPHRDTARIAIDQLARQDQPSEVRR
ncbi:MAG TPA: Chromate resistance protein ChrB [Euzebya sp.]|nr:Chromate resistance protein ChrB [Euzebya sp.]